MNLYILGNGFDRAHEMPCTYEDFCEFLKNSNREELKEFAGKLEDIYEKKELWSDFELALGHPKIDLINQINKLFDINIFGRTFVDNINKAFGAWINKLDNCERKHKYNLSKADLYFSFNYTSTLEVQYDIDNVNHIHGFVGDNFIDNHNKVIVGHGEQLNDSSIKLLKLTKKDTKKIINENIDYFNDLKCKGITRIVVIGFSYSDIDKDYFIKIKEVLSDSKWILGYYSENDRIKAQKYNQDLILNAEIKSTKDLLVEVK